MDRSRRLSVLIAAIVLVATTVFIVTKLAPCVLAESRAPTEGIIAMAERWLEVEEPVPDGPGMMTDGSGNASVELLVRHLAPDGDVDPAVVTEAVAIHDDLLRLIEPALVEGSRVFLALASEGLTREMVAYVVARTADGTHEFLSECGFDLTAEMRSMLGSRYESAMRQIVGLTDADAIYRVLADVDAAPDHVLVEYDEQPADLRMFTRSGTLIVRGDCLAIETEVGPLVPIWDDHYFLAVDDEGLVLMSGMDRAYRPGDLLEFAGREMSPTEASAVTDRRSLAACPGRLILVA